MNPRQVNGGGPQAPKATLAQLRREAERQGAELDVDRSWDSLTVYADAPEGFVWRASGGRVLCSFTYLGTKGWVAECYGDVLVRMKDGVMPAPEGAPEDEVDDEGQVPAADQAAADGEAAVAGQLDAQERDAELQAAQAELPPGGVLQEDLPASVAALVRGIAAAGVATKAAEHLVTGAGPAAGKVDGRLAAAIAKQPARRVACPVCSAPVGRPCKRPSGYTVPGGGVHAPRLRAAQGAAS